MYHLVGFEGINALKSLDDRIADDDGLDQLLESLAQIQKTISDMGHQKLAICDAESEERVITTLLSSLAPETTDTTLTVLTRDRSPFQQWGGIPQDQAWTTSTQVNFCASAFPTVAESHADGAALAVLAGVLRNGFLHGAIREKGGAYGGGASHDGANGIFRFYSYRDPNLMATFDAFQESVRWLRQRPPTFDQVEEAILGLVSSLDAPGSPAGECRQAFHQQLYGRDDAHRTRQRESLLSVTQDDVQRVAETYLHGQPFRAVLTSEGNVAELPEGFETFSI